MKRFGAVLATAVILSTAAIAFATHIGPDLSEYEAYRTVDRAAPGRGLTVTFLGVSTLLFDDGETAIMTDGFFTRPGLLSVVTRIRPDSARIMESLERAGVTRLAAVIPVHSHYDHAMDAPYVAKWTGAELVGSSSTRNVGLGAGLPDERITVAKPGEAMPFGRFRVTLLRAEHVPSPVLMAGEITAPLTPPARTKEYRLGEAYSVVVEHDGRTMLVQGSAGFLPGGLRGVSADVVFLSVAILGKQTRAHQEGLWREVVEEPGARRTFLIHWDDFLRPLNKPLRPMPSIMDDFDATMRFLLSHSGPGTPEILIPREFDRMDPFAGLPPK